MKKIKYLFKRIKNMNYKNFFKTAAKISKKEHKLKILIILDMIRCGILHQAGYVDYEFYSMYKLSHKERKLVMTRGRNNHYVSKLNPREYWHYFDNKNEFNQKFSKYLNRDWMFIDGNNFDKFEEFVSKHSTFIVKPNDLSCGKGVRKINSKDVDIKKLYNELYKSKTTLIEEVAIQHDDMNKLHPDSVNTIRIVTIVSDYGIPSVVAAVVRIGTNHNVIDNFNSGGITAMIDLETGKICSNATNTKREIFEKHPTTNVKLIGFQIPMFEEIKKMVKEAALVVSNVRLIGWDVCVGKDKPCLIEANQFPAHDLYQPLFDENNVKGVIPIFEKAISRKE